MALIYHSVQFSSVQSLSRVRLFAIPWTAARQASLSITNSRSPPKPTSIESVTPSNHLILCCPLLLLPSIFPSIRVFPNECRGPALAGSRGYPQDERHQPEREKTREISLDRAKSAREIEREREGVTRRGVQQGLAESGNALFFTIAFIP